MLGENAVRRSAAPISSAMEWKRFLKTSSSTGSRRMRRSVPETCGWSLVVGRSPRAPGYTATGLLCRRYQGGQRLTTDDRRRAPSEFFPFLQICIDTAFILPQYLVL